MAQLARGLEVGESPAQGTRGRRRPAKPRIEHRAQDPLASLRKRSHADLVRAVLIACNRLPGVDLYAVDVGGAKRGHGTPGVPDIIGWRQRVYERPAAKAVDIVAQAVGLEIKVGRDKLRPMQALYLDRLRKAGGIAAEVRVVEDAVNVLTLGVTGRT